MFVGFFVDGIKLKIPDLDTFKLLNYLQIGTIDRHFKICSLKFLYWNFFINVLCGQSCGYENIN